jgi:hypothetical protein
MTRIRDIANILSSSTNMATDTEVTSAISAQFVAGKNKIINGDFGIWQRGTSFSNPADSTFSADRWISFYNGTGATRTISQQTFTSGTAPVAGYEGQYFYRYAISAAGTGNTYNIFDQRIEDVRTFAGQTITVSFYAKADAARTVSVNPYQFFGTGGSSEITITAQNASLTTSWQRFSFTFAIPSIAGKTVGTGSYLVLRFSQPSGVTMTLDYWGVQAEAGSTSTNFTTATGTIQGELAACQRYYWRPISGIYQYIATGQNYATTNSIAILQFPVTMRTSPAITVSSAAHFGQTAANAGSIALTAFSADTFTVNNCRLTTTTAGSLVTGNASLIQSTNASATLDFGAEL